MSRQFGPGVVTILFVSIYRAVIGTAQKPALHGPAGIFLGTDKTLRE